VDAAHFVEEIPARAGVTERTPVVLLHSSGLSRRQWRRLAPLLTAEGFPVVLPDLVGHGDSPPLLPRQRARHEDDIDWLGRLLEARGRMHLVGHSYGGLIAAIAAARAPERVRSLVLIEPVAFGMLAPSDVEAREELAAIDFRWNEPFDAERWLSVFVDYWSGPGAWAALREEARAEFRRVGWAVHETVRTLVSDETPRAAYANVKAPVTLLFGERTTIASRTVTARLAETFPRAEEHAIAGAGHMAPLTHAEQVNGLVRDALLRADADRAPSH